jgi:3-dehydroquinate synthase
MNLFLYGPPASGKTTLGRELAARLALPFLDLDDQIARQAGRPVADIFRAEGEPAFRALERQALLDQLSGPPAVIALGGGALLDPDLRARVESAGPVLCLTAPPDRLLARLQSDPTVRPLLAADLPARLTALLAARADHYASFPLQLDTGPLDPPAAAWAAQRALGCFRLEIAGHPCDVRVQPGALARLGDELRLRGLRGPVALVTDQRVAACHLEPALSALRSAGFAAHPVVLPAGEEHKTLATVAGLWSQFLAAGLDRSSTVVALGGGVVSDLAGFAAATYLRGVRWVAVPTTLLGMVDASLGGKTGIDLPQGKNLAGAFHQPALVLADPRLLATLPLSELRSGLAEVVKHGVIADPELFALCESGLPAPEILLTIIRRAVAVKIAVVTQDPFESGLREVLNFGHTVGHAVERALDYHIRHGEAVSIGMAVEARLAESLGFAEPGLANRLCAALRRLGLPVELPPGLPEGPYRAALRLDKKRQAGHARLSLPVRVGEVRPGVTVDPETLWIQSSSCTDPI